LGAAISNRHPPRFYSALYIRLFHWQHKGVEGVSGSDGMIEIEGMMPGKFEFQVEAKGYTRWCKGRSKIAVGGGAE